MTEHTNTTAVLWVAGSSPSRNKYFYGPLPVGQVFVHLECVYVNVGQRYLKTKQYDIITMPVLVYDDPKPVVSSFSIKEFEMLFCLFITYYFTTFFIIYNFTIFFNFWKVNFHKKISFK